MPVSERMLRDRRGRGTLINWRADLGFGHIRSQTGETIRVNLTALQAAGMPSVGEELTFSYDTCARHGDIVATELVPTIPRTAA